MLSRLRPRHTSALIQAGGAIVRARPGSVDERASTLLEVASARHRLTEQLAEEMGQSLAADRSDYARASRWARPLVVLRGLIARIVLRDALRRTRRELKSASQALAAHAFDGDVRPLLGCIPGELAEEIAAMRAESTQLVGERNQLVAPFGGVALPRIFHWVGKEFVLFFSITWRELKSRLLPRLPALVGLFVGWWIPRTFTNSRMPGFLRLLGIGKSSKHYLPPNTFHTVSFWLPLVASIVCAYLAIRLGAFIRNRYAPNPAAADQGSHNRASDPVIDKDTAND